jgi:hypothetical protein
MDIERMKELIAQREAIDAELSTIVTGGTAPKRTLKCSLCNQEGLQLPFGTKRRPTRPAAWPASDRSPRRFTSLAGRW